MYTLILFIIIFPVCQVLGTGRWGMSAYPPTTMRGNSVSIYCYYNMNTDRIIPEMFMEIRKTKNSDWKVIAKTNTTGSYLLVQDPDRQNYSISSFYGCYRGFRCGIRIFVSFGLSSCTVDPDLYSIFRCKVSNGSQTFKSSEKSFVSTKGQIPSEMQTPNIIKSSGEIQTGGKDPFRPGDVVHLQCEGEVESVNGIPSEYIRWCKKKLGTFDEIPLQNPPNSGLVWSSKDGCTNVQKSEIFYHIMESDAHLEIMCESGYNIRRKKCGNGSANSTIILNTNIKTDGRWKVSPILMFDGNGVIDEQNVLTHGLGRTFYLTCSASSFTSDALAINWCVRKTDTAKWIKVATQEEGMTSSASKSGEYIVFSRITYHVTKYDKVLHFLCEIPLSSSSPCGSGSSFTSLSLVINAQQTATSDLNTYFVSTAALSVLLCLVLVTVVVLVIITFRRGGLTICGFVFNIQRSKYEYEVTEDKHKSTSGSSQVMTSKSVSQPRYVRHGKEPFRKSDKHGKDGSFENEGFNSEILKEEDTLKYESESKICDFDELRIEEKQQEYEEMKF
ncbi:uncharacterized protein LOC134261171 isoform X2 [Saccostrea cucullata]|uniref:uncharacterized protein LOC134261171 isoform X2 n=1 Tax=Saccostrea cuccullata TaxID=36930 RepID=UPI002ED69F8D